jgi:hypothetical protein
MLHWPLLLLVVEPTQLFWQRRLMKAPARGAPLAAVPLTVLELDELPVLSLPQALSIKLPSNTVLPIIILPSRAATRDFPAFPSFIRIFLFLEAARTVAGSDSPHYENPQSADYPTVGGNTRDWLPQAACARKCVRERASVR